MHVCIASSADEDQLDARLTWVIVPKIHAGLTPCEALISLQAHARCMHAPRPPTNEHHELRLLPSVIVDGYENWTLKLIFLPQEDNSSQQTLLHIFEQALCRWIHISAECTYSTDLCLAAACQHQNASSTFSDRRFVASG